MWVVCVHAPSPPSLFEAFFAGNAPQTIRFRLDARGTVLSYDLVGSSGHSLLDEEVVSLIRRAQPMPPFPDGIGQPTLEFIVPIAFALRCRPAGTGDLTLR